MSVVKNISKIRKDGGIVDLFGNPMTASGDIIYGGAIGLPTRLAKGIDGQVLTLESGLPIWKNASGGGSASLWTAWNASRTDNSNIASDSAGDDLPVGTMIRYQIDTGAWRFSFVDAVAARAHTLRGYPCVAGSNNFEYDASNLKLQVIQIPITDNFNDANDSTYCLNDLLLKAGLRPFSCPENYILGIDPVCTSADTSGNPTMNILVHGGANAVFASEVALGISIAKSTLTETAGEYYKFGFYGQMDIKITKGGAGDAYNGDVKIYIGRA